jgi:hypothetical protein
MGPAVTLHYHGTPLTPRRELMKLAGKHFCVSFAHPQDADWCAQNGQSVMWDNGAFSLFTKGKEIDKGALFAWLEDRLVAPHWAVCLDVIGGSVEDQLDLAKEWPFPKSLSAPVWHMGLPIKYLLHLADTYPKICFGSSAEYWQVGSEKWSARCDLAFEALSKRHRHLPWIHMLRGLAVVGKRWPFASADSVNVARNFKTGNRCPRRMADDIDAVQAPPFFIHPNEIYDALPSGL